MKHVSFSTPRDVWRQEGTRRDTQERKSINNILLNELRSYIKIHIYHIINCEISQIEISTQCGKDFSFHQSILWFKYHLRGLINTNTRKVWNQHYSVTKTTNIHQLYQENFGLILFHILSPCFLINNSKLKVLKNADFIMKCWFISINHND